MAIAEVTVVPIGTNGPSVSQYVAGALKILEQQKDVKYKLTGMGTILEGEMPAILEATRQMHESVFDTQVQRVLTLIRIDDRRDREASVERKIKSVTDRLTKS